MSKNNVPGTCLCTVFARDPDQGKNGLVLYELVDITSAGHTASSLLAVESSSGAMAAETSFDFQQLKGFPFQVEAHYGGTPLRSALWP